MADAKRPPIFKPHMQVIVDIPSDEPRRGTFLGLVTDEYGDTKCVIKFPGHGLYLSVFHPSRVTQVSK